ncbi:MAG: hypothetical protein DRI69_10130 [Bacteroidetes bacterium]|nr:MAG: hypothetical protein DRI69_10130 [Bacteroidota bacterium]
MYKFLTKHGTAMAFGLGAVVAAIGILSILGGLDGYNMLPEDQQDTTDIFNVAISGGVILTIVAFATAILFGVYQVIMNPKGAIQSILGLVVIIGMFLIFYSTATTETAGPIYEDIQAGKLSGDVSNWITGALWTTLIIFGATIFVFIFSEIRNVFK